MEQYLSQLSNAWSQWILPLLQVVIGLGVIVFVHELGHFLVAKWVGIKVEQFAFGFGKRILGFTVGETDYRINLIPLGGYVKMLGQEDFKPMKEGDKPDPRAFDQKSVGARFAVIAAGVIMNVILAVVLFVIVAMAGMQFPAPVIGDTVPGSPAYNATISSFQSAESPTGASMTIPATSQPAGNPWYNRLQPGDTNKRIHGDNIILTMNRDEIPTFIEVKMTSALSQKNDLYDFEIERIVDGKPYIGKVYAVPVQFDGSKMGFGIEQAFDTVIDEPGSIADISPYQIGDRLVKIGNTPILHFWDISPAEDRLDGKATTVTVQRGDKTVDLAILPGLRKREEYIYKTDGSSIRCRVVKFADDKTITVRTDDGKELALPEDQLDDSSVNFLGMIPLLKVFSVEKGSPADKKGIKPGDVILGYGDIHYPTRGKMMEISKDKYEKKVPTKIEILRGKEKLTIEISPKSNDKTPALGIALLGDFGQTVVAGPVPDSPAAKAGVECGATITAVNDIPVGNWIDLYRALGQCVDKDVTITCTVREKVVRTVPLGKLTKDRFDPAAYRFVAINPYPYMRFKPLEVTIKYESPLQAIGWGANQTVTQILGTYVSIRSLIMGYASLKNAMGPIGIGAAAVQFARKSFVDFIYLFAIISAAIAVFNFLPLPVMDGGYAVFLLVEKIRGKPLPMRVMNTIQMTGLVLIIGLFLAITWNDITNLISKSW